MVKSTRGGRYGRTTTMFEVMAPRRSGPWVILRPLFHGPGVLVALVVAGLLTFWWQLNLWITLSVLAVLFVGSFAAVWHVLGFVLRCRAALVVAGVLVAATIGLRQVTTPLIGNLILTGLLLAVLVVPVTGRFLWVRFWCVLDRHRLRACLRTAKARAMNLDGSLPLLLWARPTEIGERIWMWIRAGSCADDIEDALPQMAAACFARDARLVRVRKLSTLVAVDIIRRDPLSTGDSIASPLAELVDLVKDAVGGEGTDAIESATVAEITELEVSYGLPRTHGRRSTPPSGQEPTRQPVVVSGEDLSDYVD